MIYEFAIEPELAATWHERRVAYPFLSQMGLGHRRVACAFPATTWRNLVVAAVQRGLADNASAAGQMALKNIEVLLRHLQETGTVRSGKLRNGEPWLEAAKQEHRAFPFGGILVGASDVKTSYVIAADRLGEEDCPAWTPPAPPVLRQAKALGEALAPLLRSASQVRFVDPYFDADDDTFLDPMKEYLRAAQERRDIANLQIEIHLAVRPGAVDQAARLQQRAVSELDEAKARIDACRRVLGPLLQPGVSLRALAWSEVRAEEKFHNRYVLTNIGGVAVQTGLDRSKEGARHSDDLTVLSKEQYQHRWAQYCRTGTGLRLIAEMSETGAVRQGL